MPHAPEYELNLTDGATNDEEFRPKADGDPVDLTGLEAEVTIRTKQGGTVLFTGRSDDVDPVLVVEQYAVRFTPNFQEQLAEKRYEWKRGTWFWIDLLDVLSDPPAETRAPFVQGPVKVQIGSQIGGVD